MNAKLLVGGTVVSSASSIRTDVFIGNGKISEVGQLSEALPDTVERLDCSVKYVLPGGVDVHGA